MRRRSYPIRCPDDGELRLLVETDQPRHASVGSFVSHVASCERCTERVAALQTTAKIVESGLDRLESGSIQDVDRAYRMFAARVRYDEVALADEGIEPMGRIWSQRALKLAPLPIALLALMLVMSFSPARTFADDFLAQFRVKKFAAITIPMDMFGPLQTAMTANMDDVDAEAFNANVESLGTFETTFNMDVASLPKAKTIDEARASYGDFKIPGSVPGGFGPDPEAYVLDASSASYELDVARAHAIVQQLNVPIFSLPDPVEYPTVTFSVDIPMAVALKYTGADESSFLVGEMVSPTLNIPPGINMDALREDVLRFPGLSTDFVAEIRAIDDWQNTLIIPLPEGASRRDVTIDGNPGLQIAFDGGSAVVWEDDGVLHVVAGDIDGDTALDVAKSLR